MLKVIVGVRRSGKTTKMRELLAEYDGELKDLAVWCNNGIQHELGKFRDLQPKQVFTKDWQALRHKKDVFMDDAEMCKDEFPAVIRMAKENALNLTLAFSPMPVDLTWFLASWWSAWQMADEIIKLDSNWSDAELHGIETSIQDTALFRCQYKGDVLVKTREGYMELKNVK